MRFEMLPGEYTICQPARGHMPEGLLAEGCGAPRLTLLSRSERETSLLCETAAAPADCITREDGWRAFRVAGAMDFGLVGVMAEISGALAAAGVPLCAISTYDTDYVLVKGDMLDTARAALTARGHTFGEAGDVARADESGGQTGAGGGADDSAGGGASGGAGSGTDATAAARTQTDASDDMPRAGFYRHFKGGLYELLSVATHSETREPMVVYRALYGERGVWVRPAAMWNETVTRDGRTFRRFTWIGEGLSDSADGTARA